MKNRRPQRGASLLCAVLLALYGAPGLAHLMPAQQGTLNVSDGSVFMVLSLPMTAFAGVDDSGNGEISLGEFERHKAGIAETIRKGIALYDCQRARPVLDLMLVPEPSHHGDGIRQLTAMGRFVPHDLDPDCLSFAVSLFDPWSTERRVTITAGDRSRGWRREFDLTPDAPRAPLKPPATGQF